jgi:Ca-activated chloride channel family protein
MAVETLFRVARMKMGGGREHNLSPRNGAPGAVLLLGVGLVIHAGNAQSRPVAITPRGAPRALHQPANIRMDVNLILVPVTVTDLWNRPVTNLPASAFRLFEDNVEQHILNVFREDGPVSVGVLLDMSTSMRTRIEGSIAAIRRFLQSSIPGDEFFLVRFSDQPVLVSGFAANPAEILKTLPTRPPQGWTALLDAIGFGVHEMKKAKNFRRALLVLTDGGDNDSRFTESEIKNLVMESDLRVYAIGISEQYKFLEKLSAETGGKAYFARKLEDLPDVVDQLSKDLREEYILTYFSSNPRHDGKYRTLKVEVTPPPPEKRLNIAWRRGYYALPD